MSHTTVLVNGTLYDAITGLPINTPTEQPAAAAQPIRRASSSHQIHQQVQKSHTLDRHAVKSQAPVTVAAPAAQLAPKPHPTITRFAPHPAKPAQPTRLMSDIGPSVHPLIQKTEARLDLSKKQAESKPSVIKQAAINEAMEKAPRHNSGKPVKAKRRGSRLMSIASVSLALLLLAGYFTYINLPNLSVRVAAVQAGINANYPGYRPDGYRMAGVNYDKGSVRIKFAANAGPQNFTITQQQTAWDSTAVKENYVTPNWGNDVVPYTEHGLTIYSHEGNAAWVNGGILYTISGDAPLSASQVRGIATSL